MQFALRLLSRDETGAPQDDGGRILRAAAQAAALSDYLYFHLMGEPLCHPLLERFLELAGQAGFKVILTTNGTLLPKMQDILLAAPALHKVNISLHAFEANDLTVPFSEYLRGCFAFGRAAEGSKIIAYRLWNQGGADELNGQILDAMAEFFPRPWAREPGWARRCIWSTATNLTGPT